MFALKPCWEQSAQSVKGMHSLTLTANLRHNFNEGLGFYKAFYFLLIG